MSDYFDFKNKVVLVTGSSRGIGRAVAQAFAACGAEVVVNGRDRVATEKTVAELLSLGYRATGHSADVGDREQARSLVQKTINNHGGIDVVVNNAGIKGLGTIEEIDEEEWNKVMGINLTGLFYICKEVAPFMKGKNAGQIVNVASQSVLGATAAGVHYVASKGGVVAFTKALATELGPHGIRVNAVIPGFIRTDMTTAVEAYKEKYLSLLSRIPLRRAGIPDEVASACLFLASQNASYITGEIMAVNGGLSSLLYI